MARKTTKNEIENNTEASINKDENKEVKPKRKRKSKPKTSPKKTLTEKEKDDWDKLYKYVRTNVMGYDENQALSKDMVLRLKGLLVNKYMENNSIKDTANYSYEIILLTFKFCIMDIRNGLMSNTFRNEMHKFNYVLRIVEKNINTVYVRLKNAEKAKEDADRHDISNTINYVNTFKSKEDNHNNNNKYDDLW